MQNTRKAQIFIIENTKTKSKDKVIPCIKCGYPVSPYYFTAVKDVNGNTVYPKCPNCGHFDDPE